MGRQRRPRKSHELWWRHDDHLSVSEIHSSEERIIDFRHRPVVEAPTEAGSAPHCESRSGHPFSQLIKRTAIKSVYPTPRNVDTDHVRI